MNRRPALRLSVVNGERAHDNWRQLLRSTVRSGWELALNVPGVDPDVIAEVARTYPVAVNPYYLGLVRHADDPIARQCIPSAAELTPDTCTDPDPLAEEQMKPVPCLVHRYPDRVLFEVTSECAMYCRFCTRKRKVGRTLAITDALRRQAIEYIADHPEIRDVIVSGGDPLMLPDEALDGILGALRAIPHVEIIRIGTRMPCVLPQRITERLVRILRKHHPLFLNTHFEHPAEVTPVACRALARLADAGIPLGNQSVLLKGVNDAPGVFLELNRKLLANRVRPYYMYQADLVEGTNHFRTPIETGLRVLRELRGHTSGLAVPQYVIDAPGGGGKIPLLPPETSCYDGHEATLRNYQGRTYSYQDSEATHDAQ
ncbi:MAG: KamA family radical SAM protein [Pseudomonadota bacterium]